MQCSGSALNASSQYTENPNVTFTELPFYDVLCEIIKPTSLISTSSSDRCEKTITFAMGYKELCQINSDLGVRAHLRFALLEYNKEQEDMFPNDICVNINNQYVHLPPLNKPFRPGGEISLPNVPLDVTDYIKRKMDEPQIMKIFWKTRKMEPYVFILRIVRKNTSSVLIQRLKDTGVRNPEHTKAMIKEKYKKDLDYIVSNRQHSLICPVSKVRMTLPCRAKRCTHVQCFDAAVYIQMNEKFPKWVCPVCDRPASYSSLLIDGLFLEITQNLATEYTEVDILEDGSWGPPTPLEIPESRLFRMYNAENKRKINVEFVILDSDSDNEDSRPVEPPKKKVFE